MTQPSTTEAPPAPTTPGEFVARRVGSWQTKYTNRVPEGLAILARLRRGVGKEVGSVPELWRYTLEGAPAGPAARPSAGPADDDLPTAAEQAIHTAMTLFALHQQSRLEPMHTAGQSLGTAVQRLRDRSASDDAVTRRFEALGTSQTLAEAVHHARGLITQLRAHRIPLDYGMLTEDLIRLQQGRGAQVRLRWGRDFYRAVTRDHTGDTDTGTDTDQRGGGAAPDTEEE